MKTSVNVFTLWQSETKRVVTQTEKSVTSIYLHTRQGAAASAADIFTRGIVTRPQNYRRLIALQWSAFAPLALTLQNLCTLHPERIHVLRIISSLNIIKCLVLVMKS
jgi:hypothetical protein